MQGRVECECAGTGDAQRSPVQREIGEFERAAGVAPATEFRRCRVVEGERAALRQAAGEPVQFPAQGLCEIRIQSGGLEGNARQGKCQRLSAGFRMNGVRVRAAADPGPVERGVVERGQGLSVEADPEVACVAPERRNLTCVIEVQLSVEPFAGRGRRPVRTAGKFARQLETVRARSPERNGASEVGKELEPCLRPRPRDLAVRSRPGCARFGEVRVEPCRITVELDRGPRHCQRCPGLPRGIFVETVRDHAREPEPPDRPDADEQQQ